MVVFGLGLGDAWGAVTPPNHVKDACIKELGSYLLQVNILKVIGCITGKMKNMADSEIK
jgi:hypothetical protein